MYRFTSFSTYMALFMVIWLSPFTIRYKAQGADFVNTRDLQCKLRGYDVACVDLTLSCHHLKCGRLSPENNYVYDGINPPGGVDEGSQCGHKRICVEGNCVPTCRTMPTYVGTETFKTCKPVQPVTVAYNRDHQCIRRGFAGACMGYTSSCSALHCARATDGCYEHQKLIPRWGVDIGTPCGGSKICINGRCVDVVGEMPVVLGESAVYNCNEPQEHPLAPVKTRHQQCKDHGFDVACAITMPSDDACSSLSCGYNTVPRVSVAQSVIIPITSEAHIDVAPRTTCGHFHICKNGKCQRSFVIPNYEGEDKYETCHEWGREETPRRH